MSWIFLRTPWIANSFVVTNHSFSPTVQRYIYQYVKGIQQAMWHARMGQNLAKSRIWDFSIVNSKKTQHFQFFYIKKQIWISNVTSENIVPQCAPGIIIISMQRKSFTVTYHPVHSFLLSSLESQGNRWKNGTNWIKVTFVLHTKH